MDFNDTQLTDEEAEAINTDANEFLNGLREDTKDIKNVVEYPIDDSEMETKRMDIMIDPNTGEHKILGPSDVAEEFKNSFDNMVKTINESDEEVETYLDSEPITEEEATDYLNRSESNILSEMSSDPDISLEATRGILEVANRRKKGENINVYRELPKEVQNMIDKYIKENGGIVVGSSINYINAIRKNVAEALIDDFINDIGINKAKNDFARDLEQLYENTGADIAEESLNYIDERNKAYREAAEEIEDPEKKQRLLNILDQIDAARELVELKEFAKTCKIKPIELEKPENRVFSSFINKYKNSSNNIYDINTARKVLLRHIRNDGYSSRDVDAFFIAFCKQVRNYTVTKATDHAYMYYVLYYCAMLDGDKSDKFKNNVKEVIDNLRSRNTNLVK